MQKVIRVQANTLKSTIRTDGAADDRPARQSAGWKTASQDVRIYGRRCRRPRCSTWFRPAGPCGWCRKPANERSAGEKNELYEWWLPSLDRPFSESTSNLVVVKRKQDEIKASGTITHVMQERPEGAMAYILFRGEYDQRRDQVKPDTPAFLPAFPRICRTIAWGWPNGCCGPSNR